MKKLKNKVFYTVFLILSICLISFIVVFNVQSYASEKDRVDNSLNVSLDSNRKVVNKFDNPPEKPSSSGDNDSSNIKFMDSVLYTVLLDENDNIKDVVNHSSGDDSVSFVKKYASEILNSDVKSRYIGFLYFSKYSYAYDKGNCMVIVDNSSSNLVLRNDLFVSLIVFIVLEIVIFILSRFITVWISKPVLDSFEKQKRFIADASHELKTPISVIMASSDALSDNPKEKKWLVNIRNEAERMNLLVTDLLDLASSERDNMLMEVSDLSNVVLLSVLTFEGKAYEEGITFNYDIADNIMLNINKNSISQLVEILLDNAVKHSISGGIVDIVLKDDKDFITFLVKNEGDAIPLGEEEKIFDRFYRVDKSRNRNDNRYGLGLAIAKNIVVNHGGKISAFSKDGYTTFKVLFKK